MTLLEMVIAMAIMSIVFTAVVPLFAGIRNSWAARRADAEIIQNARVLTDHVYQNLFRAIEVTEISSSSEEKGYIEFSSSDSQDYRYEVDADGYVQFGSRHDLAELAGPVSQFQFTCYDGNDFATPTADAGSIRFVEIQVTIASTPTGRSRSFTTSVLLRTGGVEEGGQAERIDPGLAVESRVDWGDWGTVIDSYRSSQGPYNPLDPGADAVVCTNSTGNNRIVLWTQTTLRGDAYVGPGGDPDSGIDVSGGAEITGTCGTLDEAIAIPTLSAPTGDPFDGSDEGHLTIEDRTVVVNSDRYFKKLQIGQDGVLQIQGDVRILLNGGFDVGLNGRVEIPSGSILRLYLTARADLWGTARVNAMGADPTRLRIYMIGNKPFEIGDEAQIHAVIQNPNGNVKIWDEAEVFGKIKAKQLQGGGKLHIDLDCDFDLGAG